MNIQQIYNDDTHPVWCWEETSLFKLFNQFSMASNKESRLMFLEIARLTDVYINKVKLLLRKKDQAGITDEMIRELHGDEIVDDLKLFYERGVQRNRRAKDVANILAIDIYLREVWNETQTDSDGADNS